MKLYSNSLVYGNDTISIYGLFIYKDYSAGIPSMEAFLKAFQSGNVHFDDCIGSFRVMIDRADGSKVYFCDNAGTKCYFIHNETAHFTDTLSESVTKENRIPNYAAIAQFLYFGCIYGMETIVKEVCRSDPEYYYIVENNVITKMSKNLIPFEKMDINESALEKYVNNVIEAVKDTKIGAVITGGIDSRAVLGHLIHNGIMPELSITGSNEHVDVVIAKEISQILGANLTTISDSPDEDDWIDEAITAADGMAGVCGIYRLYKKAKSVYERGIEIEFGGAAGELYKNSFINQDFPIYFGKPNWNRFYKMKVGTYNFPLEVCGENITLEMKKIPERVIAWLQKSSGKNKANTYLAAGYRVLQARGITSVNISNNRFIACNPLIERNVAALSFHVNPYKLEMQAFQRKQVSEFLPIIKNVRTDRGLTCNDKRKAIEFIKSMVYLLKVAMGRIFHRNRQNARIDACFTEGLASKQFEVALKKCFEMKILAENVEVDKLPLGLQDRLFTVGSFFY